jgi:hypothetical protein
MGVLIPLLVDTCLTPEHALQACDPHGELAWEDASDADETKILISRRWINRTRCSIACRGLGRRSPAAGRR